MPAVAVASKFLVAPRTEPAKVTSTAAIELVTCTKRMFAGDATADPSLIYGPARFTANKTLARGNDTPLLLKFQAFMFPTPGSPPAKNPADINPKSYCQQ